MPIRPPKKVWRVPKNRGAAVYFGAHVCKVMTRHGWPAIAEEVKHHDPGVYILHETLGADAAPSFWRAVETAVRIVSETLQVEVVFYPPYTVIFMHEYKVLPCGLMKKV